MKKPEGKAAISALMKKMIDNLGRKIDYLRISVTDRCNLRCIYCMPEDGITLTKREEILREDEFVRICSVMAELGITKAKITGGEPLLRSHVSDMIGRIKGVPGIERVTLTTNGILLKNQMESLAMSGLDSINISLDTLDRNLFMKISRRDLLNETLEGIKEAIKYPEIQLKINCVPLGIDAQNLYEIAEIAERFPIHVRFIEMMPVGYGKNFAGISQDTIFDNLQKRYGKLIPYKGEPIGNGPCRYYEIDGFKGKIGFISAISHKFCSECNRIRLTSKGYLKTCLQYTVGADLKDVIRNGGNNDELKKTIIRALSQKPDGHNFSGKITRDNTESLCMSQIGG